MPIHIILAHLNDAVIITGPTGAITYANRAAGRLLGQDDPNDLVGTSIVTLYDEPADRARIIAPGETPLPAKQVNLTLKRRDGSAVQVLASLITERDGAGEVRRTIKIFSDQTPQKIVERKQAQRALQERVKELECLYDVNRLIQELRKEKKPVRDVLQKTVHFLPPAFQHPNIACARITFHGDTFETTQFQRSPWRLTSEIIVNGEPSGEVAVYYTKERPTGNGDPFLSEEQALLDTLSELLGHALEREAIARLLQDQESQTVQTMSEKAAIVDAMRDGLLVLSGEGVLVDANPAVETITGFTRAELLGQPLKGVFPALAREFDIDRVLALELKGEPVQAFETDIITMSHHHTRVPIHLSVTLSVVPLDRVERVIILNLNDVTRLKEIQIQLQEKTLALERSNEELQQFAYIASHDLQEPLRMVSSYVQLLARRYKDVLDQDAADFIEYAVDGATRMKALINDLLAFSRVNTQGRPFEKIDLNTVVETVLRDLKGFIDDTNAKVVVNPLPEIHGDPHQLGQLFQNLIHNAMKFHGDSPPEVRISAQERETDWLCSVRDNGIGIKPQYYEKIFQIFQRLHGKRKYPGTGIGLAVCKRIVTRHHGRIWVESKPDQGSTFYFTIPKNLTNDANLEETGDE